MTFHTIARFGLLAIISGGTALAVPVNAQESDAEGWEGFYIGANAGASFNDDSLTTATTFCGGYNLTIPMNAFVAPANGCYFAQSSVDLINAAGDQDVSATELAGGLQAGYNIQTGSFVLGLEADFSTDNRSEAVTAGASYTNINPTYPFVVQQGIDTDWLMTARLRAGVSTGPALIYATGGLAVTRAEYLTIFTDSPPTPPLFSINGKGTASSALSKTLVGWAAGGGAEVMVAENWSLTASLLHTQFSAAADNSNLSITTINSSGAINGTPTVVPNQVFESRVRLKANIVRIGVNYRF